MYSSGPYTGGGGVRGGSDEPPFFVHLYSIALEIIQAQCNLHASLQNDVLFSK